MVRALRHTSTRFMRQSYCTVIIALRFSASTRTFARTFRIIFSRSCRAGYQCSRPDCVYFLRFWGGVRVYAFLMEVFPRNLSWSAIRSGYRYRACCLRAVYCSTNQSKLRTIPRNFTAIVPCDWFYPAWKRNVYFDLPNNCHD